MTWPSLPTDRDPDRRDFVKALYQAQLDDFGARLRELAAKEAIDSQHDWEQEKRGWELEKAELEAEHALAKIIHDARVEVSKSAVERGRSAADFVRNAAAGLITLYTAILGLSFSATKTRLPIRGVVPAVLLGLAIVFATAYVAWLKKAPSVPAPVPHASLSEYQERRLNSFTMWASSVALGRAYALHAAVLSLGLGAIFLPLPFLAVDNWISFVALGISLVLIIAIPLISTRRND